MKSKDIINEGIFSDFERAALDTYGNIQTRRKPGKGIAGSIKSFFSGDRRKYGRTVKDQVAADKFIQKFIDGAMETLNVAVKNDLVDVASNKLVDKTQTQKQKPTKTLSKEVQVVNNEPMILRFRNQDFYIGDKGQWLDAKTNKEAPQAFQAFLHQQADIATPVAKTGAAKAKQRPAKKQAQQPAQAAPANTAQQPAQAAPAAPANKTQQPRQTVAAKAQAQLQKQAAMKQKGKGPFKKIKEDQLYDKLNFIFESYMNLLEAPQANPKAPKKTSISKYFKENFLDDFLQGINMAPAQAKIDALLKNLPTLYQTGKLKKELKDLANIAWSLAKK